MFATTARARAKIAAILRKERKTFQKEGEELLNEFFKKEEIRPEAAVIEKLCKLHNMKNEEEFLVAIGNKTIVLGDADKNELKEKQSSNWMKYLTFSFGNNKDKQQEEKEPQENQQQQEADDGEKYPEKVHLFPSFSAKLSYLSGFEWFFITKLTTVRIGSFFSRKREGKTGK